MAEIFDTHKFLFTLNYHGKIKGLKVIFLNKKNEEEEIILKNIEVSTSPISCNLISTSGEKIRVAFLKIKKVFRNEELIWDNSETDFSNSKTIKGFK